MSSESNSENSDDGSSRLKRTSGPRGNPAPKSKLKVRNLQFNRRKWKKIFGTAQKWTEIQGPAVSPFVVMRLNKGVLEWGGPSFMRGFAENEQVICEFKKAAFSRPLPFGYKATTLAKTTKAATSRSTLDLDKVPITSLPVASMRRLLTELCNPKALCGFWKDERNKPSWWPIEVPFQSPNWVSGGGSKLKCHHLVHLLKAYEAAEGMHRQHSGSSQQPKPPSPQPVPQASVTERVHDNFKRGEYRSCLVSLEHLEWEDLQNVCGALLPLITAMKPVLKSNLSVIDFSADKVDEGRSQLARMPRGYAPLHSTGDGDCLFHSLSLLMNGNEEFTIFLRLAATVYGVCHAGHYVSTYLQECTSVHDACAFMHMMCPHPAPTAVTNWTQEEIIAHAIQDQAASTAKVKSYSGILQVLFAAGYLGVFIQQHSEDYAPGYDTLLNPCGCEEQDDLPVLHVMWVKVGSTGAMNHFIPLVPRRAQSRHKAHKRKRFNLEGVVESFCSACLGAVNMCQADVLHLDTWVECDVCHGWYHCLCTGISHGAAEKMKFQCCSLNCSTSVAKLEGCTISVGDINRVRNGEDLSGDAIDFFMRHLMSNDKHPDAFICPYFVGQLFQSNSWLQILPDEEAIPRMGEHLRAIGISPLNLQHVARILIPVCISNHWIGLVVEKKDKTLLILDSLPGVLTYDTYHTLHRFVCRYLQLVACSASNNSLMLEESLPSLHVPKVKQQDNMHNCGLFLALNFEALLNGGVDTLLNICSNGVAVRRRFIRWVYEYTTH